MQPGALLRWQSCDAVSSKAVRVVASAGKFVQILDERRKSNNMQENTMEKNIETSEDLVNFGKGNVAAFVRSSQIWTDASQALGEATRRTNAAARFATNTPALLVARLTMASGNFAPAA